MQRFLRASSGALVSDPPNRLLQPEPVALGNSWRSLLILLLLAAIPRMINAVRQPCECYDVIRYLQWSDALSAGRYNEALGYLNVNVYLVLLNAMRATGFDVAMVGRCWSTLASVLVVLPLYGWVRRQFDTQTAFLACLLYAVHDAFAADAPLVTRDSTFWLFAATTLYLAWRAATELRWWQFAACGMAFTLAFYTRTEGFLLVFPVVGWIAARWWNAPMERGRLVRGGLLLAAMLPLFLLIFNTTVLRGHDRWEWGHIWAINPIASYFQRMATGQSVIDVGQIPDAASLAWHDLARKQGVRLVQTVGFVHGILLVLGCVAWRRVWSRPDGAPLVLMSLGNIAAVGVVWLTGMFDRRYYLPLVLASLPCMAAGLTALTYRVQTRWLPGEPWDRTLRRVAAVVAVFAFVLLLLNPRPFEEAQLADLGRWIRKSFGVGSQVLMNSGRNDRFDYIEYYAGCQIRSYDSPEMLEELLAHRPDAIVFWKYEKAPFWDPGGPADFAPFETAFRQLEFEGYSRVESDAISPRCGRMVVLTRGKLPVQD